jgi:hypothetical protein
VITCSAFWSFVPATMIRCYEGSKFKEKGGGGTLNLEPGTLNRMNEGGLQ